ncbi:AgmX/PglI C-terminal domain-containing protein [Chondromyces crocatus]|nr:AgmX/PglI C-terminal domain-containing protein [Chondromyces crocatus]
MVGCRPEAPPASPDTVAVIDPAAGSTTSAPASATKAEEPAQDTSASPSDATSSRSGPAGDEDPAGPTKQYAIEVSREDDEARRRGVGQGGGGLRGVGQGGGGLSGVGQGGGGKGESSGAGSSPGAGSGFGRMAGSKSAGANVHPLAPKVQGKLSSAVIEQVVQKHINFFRFCYELALEKDPMLRGGVNVTFVIGKEGKVTSTREAASDLGNKEMTTCVVHSFQALKFPEPEGGGVVTVTYPLRFYRGAPLQSDPPAAPAPKQ